MKGISYLVDERGKKTHVVLDLDLWETWQQFVRNDENEEALLADSIHDLQDELNALERDVPPVEIDAWLAAFDNA